MQEIDEYFNLIENDVKKARIIERDTNYWMSVLEKAPNFKHEVVLNKFLPDNMLNKLSMDEDDDIRLDVSMKRRLPLDVFALLSKDENDSVRMGIANNPNTPIDILKNMLNDSWDEIVEVIDHRINNKDKL